MRPGGLETVVLTLAKGLTALGHDVEVITLGGRGEWFDRIAEAGVTSKDLSRRLRPGLLGVLQVAARMAKQGYNLVFSNHVKTIQLAMPWLPEGMQVIPVLHSCHPNIRRLASINADAWTTAIAVSPSVQDLACKEWPDKKIIQVNNGIEIPCRANRAKHSVPLQLLFVGRLKQNEKGIFLLPGIVDECLSRGLKVKLEIIGAGPDEEPLRTRIASNVEPHITMRGGLSPAEVGEAMDGSHVLLLPSFYEGMPLVPLEAQARGCVPICSLLKGITDVAVADGRTGFLVPQGSAKSFAEKISLLADRDVWERMSRAATQHATESFSSERMASGYSQVIENVLSEDFKGRRKSAGARKFALRCLG